MARSTFIAFVTFLCFRITKAQTVITRNGTILNIPVGFNSSNPSTDQLLEYAESHPVPPAPPVVTSSYGTPVDDITVSLTAGPQGPILLQDTTFLESTHFINRERIPERTVHAKGAGAFGNLRITGDITQHTLASVFRPGSYWNVTVRFSKVVGELGSQDTRSDTRGFAVKIYTDQGIWDLVGNNSPVFFIRDPMLFSLLLHAIMRNPTTHLSDPNAFWDFMAQFPQAVAQLLIQFSDYGTPLSLRYMDGFSIHAFTLVNAAGNITYAKFRWRSNQGVKFLTTEQANLLASSNPDYYVEDLYNAIGSGNYPSWNLTAQILTPEQVTEFPFYPFDATKDWNTTTYPEIPIGMLTLNQNPPNYFVGVESSAFHPGHLVPGIQPTLDRLLQGRLFSYSDAQAYRVGNNGAHSLLRNAPMSPVHNYLRDGPGDYGNNQGNAVNYYRNSFNGPVTSPIITTSPFPTTGNAGRYSNENDDNYSQGTGFYENVLTPVQRTRLVNNLVAGLKTAYPFLQVRNLVSLCNVGADLCQRLSTGLGITLNSTVISNAGQMGFPGR